MPRKRVPPRPDPLVLEVVAALGAGRVHAASLRDEDNPEGLWVYGMCEPPTNGRATITVNEAENLIDTIIHECIHAIRPAWSERAVRGRTTRVLRSLTQAERERIHSVYAAVKHNRRRKVV